MPLCPDHNALFVHIPKTGGQSLSRVMTHADAPQVLETLGDDYNRHHLPAELMRARMPAFDSYFRFAVVRNPWDRLVSEYHYRVQHTGGHFPYLIPEPVPTDPSFDWFVRRLESVDLSRLRHVEGCHLYPQSAYLYSADHRLLVDLLCRFETYGADVRAALERAGCLSAGADPLSALNTSRHAPYQAYYCRVTRELVGRRYKEDVERFGYKFEG